MEMRNFILGLILSIIYTLVVLPSETGEIPKIHFTFYPFAFKGMIYIPISEEKCIHVHHWILFLALLFFHTRLPPILVGFSFGLFIQGLTYDDAFTFIVANPYSSHRKLNLLIAQ
jgi:hypothetical protein